MTTKAYVKAIEFHLPEEVLTNEALANDLEGWTAEKIADKTGISERRVAAREETASDLGIAAAQKLFASGVTTPEAIDFIVLCTQSPDYFLPTTACIMQDHLGIPTTAGAFDFNLGCSGYVYGLGIVKGLIETGQARNVLLITAETYTKFIHKSDKSVRTLFGDGAAATLVSAKESEEDFIGPFVYGTDGAGWQNLIVPTGGMKEPRSEASAVEATDASGNTRTRDNLFMNGPQIFTFARERVPQLFDLMLQKTQLQKDDFDLFVFHQASEYMLSHLRKKLNLPPEKFPIGMGQCGNTVCATLPIALKQSLDQKNLADGMRLMLVGFGVGYSWGGCVLRWTTP